MKNLFLALFLFGSMITFGQNMESSQITGKWTVVKATPTDMAAGENAVILNQLQKGFENAQFEVKEGGDFYATFPANSPEFMEELTFLNNKNWEWQKETNMIKVGTTADNFSMMHIVVTPAGDKTFFVVPGLKLEVVRS